MRAGSAVAVCVWSFRTVCTATQWLSVWTTLTDSVQTRCNCITQRSQVMPVNNTDTKPTHKTIRILPHVQAVCSCRTYSKCIGCPFDQGQQDCSPAPCSLTAYCDTHKFSGSSIHWEFSRIVLGRTERYSYYYLSFLINYYFLMHTKKPDCRSTFVRKAVSTINKVSKHRICLLCPTDIWFPVWNTPLSLLYPKYRPVYVP
jgi:hypothetical protein